MTTTNQFIIVATQITTKRDANGIPRSLFLIDKHTLDNQYPQRIDIIEKGYEGKNVVLNKYPEARFSNSEILVSPSEYKRWIHVMRMDEKHREEEQKAREEAIRALEEIDQEETEVPMTQIYRVPGHEVPFTLDCVRGNSEDSPPWMRNHHRWTITLKHGSREMTFPYFQEPEFNSEPTIRGVLDYLLVTYEKGKLKYKDFLDDELLNDNPNSVFAWMKAVEISLSFESLFQSDSALLEDLYKAINK